MITTPEDLLKEICRILNYDINKVKAINRSQELVQVRQYYAYIGSVHFGFSFKNLANQFGQHHSTLIKGRDTVKDLLDSKDDIATSHIALLLPIAPGLNITDLSQLKKKYALLLKEHQRLQAELRRKDNLITAYINVRRPRKNAKV